MQDIRNCVQVSRSWREAAANTLTNQICYAVVDNRCKDICKLSRLLKSSNGSMINALKVHIPWDHCTCDYDITEKEAKTLCDNFNKVYLRALDLYVGSCDAADVLLQQILLQASSSLEELTLTYCVSSDYLLFHSAITFPYSI